MSLSFNEAQEIAETLDVSTKENRAVVYSISYLPTTQNRDEAYAFVKANPDFKTLDHTPCGKKIWDIESQSKIDFKTSEIKEIWKTASYRFIAAASGNLRAFVDGADPRSVFCSVEIPQILKNEKIRTINGIDKEKFLSAFQNKQQKQFHQPK